MVAAALASTFLWHMLWGEERVVAGNEKTIAALKAASGPTRWQKGQSGNPAGRVPKDRVLQTYVATKTHDGRKMVGR